MLITYLLIAFSIQGQSFFTDPGIESILQGDYDPSEYYDDPTPTAKDEIKDAIMNDVSPEALKSYLLEMNAFRTRNTGSDTLGNDGIGAARDYALAKFQSFSETSASPLMPTFFEFNETSANSTKGIFKSLSTMETESRSAT